jgi:DNA-binding response OmpR family regulator
MHKTYSILQRHSFNLMALALMTAGAVSAQAQEVRVMCYQDGVECDVTAELAKKFEAQNPGVKIVVDTVPYKTIVEQTPHLVVSDVNMPRLDGFALCRKLRGEQNFVPLLLLTSRGDEIDEALGLELGADDYRSTPFSTRVLLARAQVLMRRERGASER